jgi:hypothetical protein
MGFVGDEVQTQFKEEATALDPRVLLLKGMQVYARYTPGALLVLSGSSADLRARIFADGRPLCYKEYPQFNRSLCNFENIAPLREMSELTLYLHARYPGRAAAGHFDNAQFVGEQVT